MKKIILTFAFIVLSSFFFSTPAQEVPCDLPLGWACGAKKGKIDEGHWQWIPLYGYVWISNWVDCCVVSIPTNACQPFDVGCTQVLPS